MAPIGSQFDLNKALSKESYAYDCCVNKNYENKTLGITNPEMIMNMKSPMKNLI